MKVICINDIPGKNYKNLPENLKVIFQRVRIGETYTVTGDAIDCFNRPVFQLEELPHPGWPQWGWAKHRFAPLSDIDETEMIREYNKELV